MKTAIIVSKQDTAGMNIKARLLEMYPFKEEGGHFVLDAITLHEFEKETIFLEDIDKEIDADQFIFATKHASRSAIPSLSVHSPGNWGKAEAGGRDKELCAAPPSLLRFALQTIERLAPYEIVQECTHHGPYLEKPCMFIEIGSTEKEWGEKEPAVVIAKTIMHVLTNPVPEYKAAFGIGGMHTTPAFRRVIDHTDYAFGHVCPKYMLEELDEGMIRQGIERNTEKVDLVMLDYKGLKTEKARIIELLDNMGIAWKKSRDVYKD